MGQAKIRGTFEQRRLLALDREEQQIANQRQAALKRQQEEAERVRNLPEEKRAVHIAGVNRSRSSRLLLTTVLAAAMVLPTKRSAK
jgi:hypothetical protein